LNELHCTQNLSGGGSQQIQKGSILNGYRVRPHWAGIGKVVLVVRGGDGGVGGVGGGSGWWWWWLVVVVGGGGGGGGVLLLLPLNCALF
jgi:hypothetical protein